MMTVQYVGDFILSHNYPYLYEYYKRYTFINLQVLDDADTNSK